MTFAMELEDILRKELEILIKLKELSLKKTDMIIENSIQALEEMTKKEEVLINEMGNLELEREKLLDNWGVATNTPISHIIENIPTDNSEIINIKDRMVEEVEELNLRNKLNNDLIKENLGWIEFNMNLITNTHNEPGYGNKPSQTRGNSIFDRKV